MTLNSRNQIFIGLTITFCSAACIITTIFAYALLTGSLSQPTYPTYIFNTQIPLLAANFIPIALSLFVLLFFAPLAMYVCYHFFEKTQSVEIFFFSGFLISCIAEATRLLLPCFDLWKTYSPFLLFIGRLVFGGRMLCPLAFLVATILDTNEQRMNTLRNFTLLLAVSVVFGSFIPLNTVTVTSSCLITWGFDKFFTAIQITTHIITASSLLLQAYKHENNDVKEEAIGFILLITGYTVLINTDNYVFLVIGTAMLGLGAKRYLRSIHTLYLWK